MNMERFTSVVHGPVGKVSFPEFRGAQAYMHPIDLAAPTLPSDCADFAPVVALMIRDSGITPSGAAFVTIDQRHIRAGQSHRRPGPHVDGNFIFDWGGGGGGWLTGVAGRVLSPENHRLQYCNPMGGMLIASDAVGCRVWRGEFSGQPKQGGDCSHLGEQLDSAQSWLMEAGAVYLGNSTCVHESLPFAHDVRRTLVRITLPSTVLIA